MQDPFQNNNQNDPNNNNQDPLSNIPLPPNYAKIVQPETGQIRIAKVGISWTTLWFGPIPAMMRGDWYNCALIIIFDMIYAMGVSMLGFQMALPLPALIFGFIYNLMFFRHSFNLGYQPADERSKELLINSRYLKDNSN